MRKLLGIVAIGGVLTLSGCFHAVIETGRPASTQTVDIPWAHSFLYGLVPPASTDASVCANGVARVETQHSFVNGLAAVLTFSVYTPMHITVTCAQGGGVGAASFPFSDLVMDLTGSGAASPASDQ